MIGNRVAVLFKLDVVVAAHPNLIDPLAIAITLLWERIEGRIIKLKETTGSALWVRPCDSIVELLDPVTNFFVQLIQGKKVLALNLARTNLWTI